MCEMKTSLYIVGNSAVGYILMAKHTVNHVSWDEKICRLSLSEVKLYIH